MQRTAIISDCRHYRYRLGRLWRETPGRRPNIVPWVLCNPAFTDRAEDDATICRMVEVTRTWGFDGLSVYGLLPVRASSPATAKQWLSGNCLHKHQTRKNLGMFRSGIIDRRMILAAWGDHFDLCPEDMRYMLNMLAVDGRLFSLGTNEKGSPVEPLDAAEPFFAYPYAPVK